jgi:hypothetical protein
MKVQRRGRNVDWDSVDWLNKTDMQLAISLGFSSASYVGTMRKKLGKPKATNIAPEWAKQSNFVMRKWNHRK